MMVMVFGSIKIYRIPSNMEPSSGTSRNKHKETTGYRKAVEEFVELMRKGGQGAADEGRISKCAFSSPSGSHGARKFLTAW